MLCSVARKARLVQFLNLLRFITKFLESIRFEFILVLFLFDNPNVASRDMVDLVFNQFYILLYFLDFSVVVIGHLCLVLNVNQFARPLTDFGFEFFLSFLQNRPG